MHFIGGGETILIIIAVIANLYAFVLGVAALVKLRGPRAAARQAFWLERLAPVGQEKLPLTGSPRSVQESNRKPNRYSDSTRSGTACWN